LHDIPVDIVRSMDLSEYVQKPSTPLNVYNMGGRYIPPSSKVTQRNILRGINFTKARQRRTYFNSSMLCVFSSLSRGSLVALSTLVFHARKNDMSCNAFASLSWHSFEIVVDTSS